MPVAAREWASPPSMKNKKVKFARGPSAKDGSRGTAQPSNAGKPPASATPNPYSVLAEEILGPPAISQETSDRTNQDPTDSVGPAEPGSNDIASAPDADEEEGEITSTDADIPESIARALLDALQEKRVGNHFPAALIPLARIRASQLRQCITKGDDPSEAVFQATVDLIAVEQGSADPEALTARVSMERLASGVDGSAAFGTLLTDVADYFDRAPRGAALATLQQFDVPSGTPFSSFLRSFRVVVASIVDKGGPLAPPPEMAMELIRIRTAQQYPMLMPILFRGF